MHAGALRGQEKMLSVLELQLTDNGESPDVGRVLPHSTGLSGLKACVK